MRQRKKTREEKHFETLTREIEYEEEDEKKESFFACYLLVSLSPRHKGQTYIGFTVNPRRRIRQHNGEIQCGAWRTKRKRPWEMVLCIHGFPSNVEALKFEWAWQHPNESLAVKKAAASFKSLFGIANKIKLAFTMLNLPSWQSMNLSVNYFSTKYTNNSAGCPTLPRQMKVRIRPMDELPCYVVERERFSGEDSEWDDDKWRDESSDEAAKDPEEEYLSNRVFKSSHEHDMNSADEASNHDSEETSLSPLVKEGGFRSELLIILDDDEIEVKDWEDIPCNRVFESSEERDTSERSRWTDGEADRREWSCFNEPIKRISSPSIEAGNHSFVEEISEDTALSPWIKNGGFRSESLITLDDDEEPPPQERRQRTEIEVIDVSTPSPLCGNSFRGKKRRLYTVFPDFIDLTKSPGFVQL